MKNFDDAIGAAAVPGDDDHEPYKPTGEVF